MTDVPPPAAPWSLVLPVKRLKSAKSRLAPLPPDVRAALALAFAADTLDAVLACPVVGRVLVVTDDDAVVALARERGADVLVPAGPGLNAAVEQGWSQLPDGPVVGLTADLPALRSDALADALAQAAQVDAAFVADADGTGTTTVTTRTLGGRPQLRPQFGVGSAAAHLVLGAVAVTGPLARLRRDVDTPQDLDAARVLGVGRATSDALAATRVG